MASVITSARTSTASIFDMVGDTANATAKLIRTASRSIDALDSKVDTMTDGVIANSRGTKAIQRLSIADTLANDHMDLMEASHRKNFPDLPFDRPTEFAAILETITAAIGD